MCHSEITVCKSFDLYLCLCLILLKLHVIVYWTYCVLSRDSYFTFLSVVLYDFVINI